MSQRQRLQTDYPTDYSLRLDYPGEYTKLGEPTPGEFQESSRAFKQRLVFD